MDAQQAIDLGREAVWMTLLVSSPILLAGMAIGLVVGLAQALTQIQEQTVAFVPKLIVMILCLSICLPWLVTRMVEYTQGLITNIPQTIQ